MTHPVPNDALEALGLPTVMAMLECAPDACTLSRAIRDGEGRAIDMTLLWMNAAGRAGQPDAMAAVGRTCRELWPQMVANGSFAACMRVLDAGGCEHGEFDWTDAATYAGGYYHWTATRIGDDLLLWTLRDASQRYSRALQAEARLAGILSAAPDPIIVIDEDGQVTLANEACRTLLGWPPEELVGKSADVLLPPDETSGHRHWLQRYLASGERRLIGIGRDVPVWHRDGRVISMRISVSETTLLGRRVYTGILHDLTARQQLEQQLRHAQKMEVVGRLVSSVAHDFNNLLTIMTAASTLLEPYVPAGTGQQLLGELTDAAERGAALTQQLMSRVRYRPSSIAALDVSGLLAHLEPSAARLAGRDVTLCLDLAGPCAPVRADAPALEQAILNLVVNARDAMPEGGTLTIAARQEAADASAGRPGPHPWLRLSVHDTGIGMTPEVQARAFEPFFTTKPEGRGTGLGLPSVRDVVDSLGGRVDLETAPGRGTAVHLWLPCLHDATVVPASAVTDGRGSETVLLVDDDEAILRLMEQALRAEGYVVHGATHAAEARRVLAQCPQVDILVCDLVLPDADGRTLTAELLEARPRLRVLLTSGFGATLPTPSLPLPPRAAYLAKPFTARELASRLQDLVRASASA